VNPSNAYNPNNVDFTDIRMGYVRRYYPAKRLYQVVVDNKGEVLCKHAVNGVIKALPINTRVLMGRCLGTEWMILAEAPQSSVSLENQADSLEETLVVGRGRLLDTGMDDSSVAPSYRFVDGAGESDLPLYEGEVIIENTAPKNIAKSFLKIFKFGDIFIKASYRCFITLHRLRSAIVMRSRDFY